MALVKCKECKQEISQKADNCPACGSPQKAKHYNVGWLFLVFIVGWLVVTLSDNSRYDAAAAAIEKAENERKTALNNLKLEYKWAKSGFGNIMEADFTISNDNPFAVKDLKILCTGSAKSGTKIDKNENVIYEVVPAKGKKSVYSFNMGFINSQVERVSCVIVNFAK